ncbi:MAG: hypothetical protein SFX18_06635 [Pirellulales bacterium]|nr:hypothetical protein [Pirellulales bacterium]
MPAPKYIRWQITVWLLGIAGGLLFHQQISPCHAEERLTFEQIIFETQRVTTRWQDYEPGDLIRQSQAQEFIQAYRALGWDVPDAETLLAKVPADGEYLFDLLATRGGKPFMREIATIPSGYDKLDRLLQLPDGKQLVKQLINARDGNKLIAYLASTKGGKNLGKMLGAAADVDFNAPTGRIYTVRAFIQELQPLFISK